jgi:purine-nucleoside phosphorylase
VRPVKRALGVVRAAALTDMPALEKVRSVAAEFVRVEDDRIEAEKIRVAAEYIQSKLGGRRPTVLLTLGSGLGDLADKLENRVIIPYSEIPCFPNPAGRVEGHAGNLVVGELEGKTVAVMQGRFHLYQFKVPQMHAQAVVRPLRTMIVLGVTDFVVTNAVGAIKPRKFRKGDLVLNIDGHNMSGCNPLAGSNPAHFGSRFPDVSDAFTPQHLDLARRVAADLGIRLKEGVQVQVLGPNYEWPPEIKMLQRTQEFDLVGMSTVIEVLAAHHAGIRTISISLVTNVAAGLSKLRLEHKDVENEAEKARPVFQRLIRRIVAELS